MHPGQGDGLQVNILLLLDSLSHVEERPLDPLRSRPAALLLAVVPGKGSLQLQPDFRKASGLSRAEQGLSSSSLFILLDGQLQQLLADQCLGVAQAVGAGQLGAVRTAVLGQRGAAELAAELLVGCLVVRLEQGCAELAGEEVLALLPVQLPDLVAGAAEGAMGLLEVGLPIPLPHSQAAHCQAAHCQAAHCLGLQVILLHEVELLELELTGLAESRVVHGREGHLPGAEVAGGRVVGLFGVESEQLPAGVALPGDMDPALAPPPLPLAGLAPIKIMAAPPPDPAQALPAQRDPLNALLPPLPVRLLGQHQIVRPPLAMRAAASSVVYVGYLAVLRVLRLLGRLERGGLFLGGF
jgi:hypothetical protein